MKIKIQKTPKLFNIEEMLTQYSYKVTLTPDINNTAKTNFTGDFIQEPFTEEHFNELVTELRNVLFSDEEINA